MNKIILIKTFCKDTNEATFIAKSLLKKKLIACANLIPQCTSLYFWEGDLCQEKEVLLMVKTTSNHRKVVEDSIESLHSYSLPVIIAQNTLEAKEPLLKWINDSVNS